MTAEAGAPRRAAALPPVPLHRRIYGFGSIYGKTIRDSRLAFIIAAGLMGGLALFMGAAISNVFPTEAVRQDINGLIGGMPHDLVNLFGKPVELGTLGGYMSWKYGATFALGASLWSILALSGTLAGEARRGSLDLVAAAPFGKRRIALEKLGAHVTMLVLAMAVVALCITTSSSIFGDAALGDKIPPLDAIGFTAWMGALALCFGGLAFALGPLLGRAGAAGLASAVMLVLWVANGFTAMDAIAVISPFRWVELFARRDLGVTIGLSLPGLPASVLGVRGPISRAFGEQLPRAVAWGVGMGIFGVMLVSLVGSFSAQVAKDSALMQTIGQIFPNFKIDTAGGWLQLFVELLFIAAGFAGTMFVAKWASDETGERLEMLLSTPMSRWSWVVTGGIAALLAVVVMNALLAAGIAIGAVAGGVPVGDAILGSTALGLFAAAMVGVGVAVGGLWRTSIAAELAAGVVIVTYLVDLLAPPLNWPDWLHHLALTANLGQPMIGDWNAVGVIACVVIAAGGVLLGAWGFARRDVTD
jgi:ABC-2 type transport system permease protein